MKKWLMALVVAGTCLVGEVMATGLVVDWATAGGDIEDGVAPAVTWGVTLFTSLFIISLAILIFKRFKK